MDMPAKLRGTVVSRGITVGTWYVEIFEHPRAGDKASGYYENTQSGEGGGLWIEGKSLVDYDGRFFLPIAVRQALTDMDINTEGG